jgi:hypothetical protein
MIKFKDILNESSQYQVYHNSYTSAINTALDYVESRGYTYDETDTHSIIGLGPKKPSPGKTNRLTIPIYKNGKEHRAGFHIQVYRMDSSRYELNCYVG